MYHGLLVNPGITGNRDHIMASSSYRNQWLGNSITPQTFLFSIHTPLKNEKVAIGLQSYADRIGYTNRIGLGGYAAYKIYANKFYVSFGLKAGLYATQTDWSKVETINENDPNFKNIENNLRPGLGFGIYLKSDKGYIGLSIPEFTNNLNRDLSVGLSPNNWNKTFVAGYVIELNRYIDFLPHLLVRQIGNNQIQPDITGIIRINEAFDLGLIYRHKGIVGISFDISITPLLQIGYTFDTGLTELNPANTFGNHEVSMAYKFKKTTSTPSIKFF